MTTQLKTSLKLTSLTFKVDGPSPDGVDIEVRRVRDPDGSVRIKALVGAGLVKTATNRGSHSIGCAAEAQALALRIDQASPIGIGHNEVCDLRDAILYLAGF